VRLGFVRISSSLESSEDDSSSDDSGDCLFFVVALIFLFVSLINSTESEDAERFLPDVHDFFLFTELVDMEHDDEEGDDGNSCFRLEPFLLELCFFSLLLL